MTTSLFKAEKEIRETLVIDPLTGFPRPLGLGSLYYHMAESVSRVVSDYTWTQCNCPSLMQREAERLPLQMASAICWPERLSPQQIARILVSFGTHVGWYSREENPALIKMLERLPGGPDFVFADPELPYAEKIRLRLLSVPRAHQVTIDESKFRQYISGLGFYRQGFAMEIDAIGYIEHRDHSTFYFREETCEDDIILYAKLKYQKGSAEALPN